MSSKGASLTAEEIVALSQDCDFVYKMISRGLKDVTTDKDILLSCGMIFWFPS